MHAPDPSPAPAGDSRGWWRELNRYHWFVLVVAMLGWLFDTMDQQLFNLARAPAVADLTKGTSLEASKATVGGVTTMIFMFGWATGGLIFGVLGDRIGRAKTMALTIGVYSLFTGLSALSTGVWDFCVYRFLTGLGVGGEFAVGVALVAETMPERARASALAWLQASSAIGNCMAAVISMVLGSLKLAGTITADPWRIKFVIGALPALLVILIMRRLQEPPAWKRAASGKRGVTMADLFRHPTWRRNAIVGLLLAFPGVVGLWGVGFFSFDLIRRVFAETFQAQGLTPAEVEGKLTFWVGVASLLQNISGFFGVLLMGKIMQAVGRRPGFLFGYLAAMAATAFTFLTLGKFNGMSDVFWIIPILGLCQFTLFGGYAVYFPELFPTRLRSTGISFCYNVSRYVAAFGPLTLGLLADVAFSRVADQATRFRYAGLTMSAVFLIGIAALPFAPETKGRPLPEDDEPEDEKGDSMTAPEWLTEHGGGLKRGLNDETLFVTIDGHPQYRLVATPAAGQFVCVVVQTVNGRRLDAPGTFDGAGKALDAGLEALRGHLGW